MAYYAVASGTIFRCVCADDPREAAIRATKQHLEEYLANPDYILPPLASTLYEVHECGKPEVDNYFFKSGSIAKQGSFLTKKH